MAQNTILLKGSPDYREGIAAEAITPGHLVDINTAGKLRKHNVSGGIAPKSFALDNIIGGGVDDAYVADESVRVAACKPGDQIYALLPAAAVAVVIGDNLMSNGTGHLAKLTDPTATAIAAALETGDELNNNAITWTAAVSGKQGNAIEIQLKDPAGNNQALSVTVTGQTIVVSLATDGGGVITSTAAQVIAAVAASIPASNLVSGANTGASTGFGVVAAVAPSNLSGGDDGEGGFKKYPVAKALEAVDNSLGLTAARIKVEVL